MRADRTWPQQVRARFQAHVRAIRLEAESELLSLDGCFRKMAATREPSGELRADVGLKGSWRFWVGNSACSSAPAVRAWLWLGCGGGHGSRLGICTKSVQM